MLIEEREVDVADLRVGMYVSRLDREWVGTPFPLQGFTIASVEDIERIAGLCRHVVIDLQKSHVRLRDTLQGLQRVRPGKFAPDLAALKDRQQYPVVSTVEEELPFAREATEKAHTVAADIMRSLRAGEQLREEDVDAAVTPLVDTLLRNPDAYFWLEALRQHDTYSYSHAVNCCALMAAFGRHLGFPSEMLRDLASGGLLLDIGKTAIPEEVLDRSGPLAPDEHALVCGHIEHSVRLYDESGANNPHIREMIRTHHEREDGSGYPGKAEGALTPLFGRIAGIVDSFDAMTSERPYRAAQSKHSALQQMYRERGKLFQADLIEQFVQCLGVYPVGTMVELNTGEVAIVMGQNPVRRLFPRVMLLTDADKQLRSNFEALDLRDTAAAGEDGKQVTIVRSLEPGAYGLDPKELYL